MNILDPRFKYTPAAETDLRETFRRIRNPAPLLQQVRVTMIVLVPEDAADAVELEIEHRLNGAAWKYAPIKVKELVAVPVPKADLSVPEET